MDEYKDEIKEEDVVEESQSGQFKQWLQDNLRIIISVLIVVTIAGGIYSYSKRSEAPTITQQDESESVLDQISGGETKKDDSTAVSENNKEEVKGDKQNQQITSTATSQETENSFVETAAKGDSRTKLARRSLANYLEKNPDSSLSAEHKIYIEDYLQKRVNNKNHIQIGTSVEFSKSAIQEAIAKSKSLNQNQLKNLHKYAVRVPSLS